MREREEKKQTNILNHSEDLLLPWSCCVAQFLAEEEEKERKLNEPEALANTIRHRLMAKNQVIINY